MNNTFLLHRRCASANAGLALPVLFAFLILSLHPRLLTSGTPDHSRFRTKKYETITWTGETLYGSSAPNSNFMGSIYIPEKHFALYGTGNDAHVKRLRVFGDGSHVIDTWATAVSGHSVNGLVYDSGNDHVLYSTGNTNKIFRIPMSGPHTLYAGSSSGQAGNSDATPGTSARFNRPTGLCLISYGGVNYVVVSDSIGSPARPRLINTQTTGTTTLSIDGNSNTGFERVYFMLVAGRQASTFYGIDVMGGQHLVREVITSSTTSTATRIVASSGVYHNAGMAIDRWGETVYWSGTAADLPTGITFGVNAGGGACIYNDHLDYVYMFGQYDSTITRFRGTFETLTKTSSKTLTSTDTDSPPPTTTLPPTTTTLPPTTLPPPTTTTLPPPTTTTLPPPTTTASPNCTCPSAVTADYKNTLVPDAAKVAYAEIALNTNTWNVEFDVKNVLAVTNGHVIAAGVSARTGNVTAAIEALVSSPFDAASLWNPAPQCDSPLSGIDVPASSLGVTVQAVQHNCTRNFHVTYSLIDAYQRTSHCTLSNTAQNEVEVSCELELNTIRAYDATEAWAYLAKETVFRASITMPRNLPNEVSTLLHASLAKCSVFAAPDFYLDCRVPSLWNFNSTFAVTQSPSWIVDSSCAQTNSTDATYIRCDLQSVSQIFTEATATITATVLPSGEQMNFAVNYSLPREETATATGSLASFVKSIGTKDGKFFYGNDDLLTLEIEVVDTARLQITQLELFNSDSPVQTYDLRSTPEFATVESQNATFFVIAFYPARKLDDSNFYLHGPHGVNVSFLFTAARRQADAPEPGDKGVVTYSGLALKAPRGQEGAAEHSASTSGPSTTVVAAVAAGALFAVVAVVATAVLVVRRRRAAAAATSTKRVPSPIDVAEAQEGAAVVDVAEV